MARVKMEIKCQECGNTFEHIHYCRNMTEAEKYEQWARKNITTCRKCAIKLTEEATKDDKEALEKRLNLPELSGSEKQIAWARSIRYDILKEIPDNKMDVLRKTIDGLTENDFTEEELVKLKEMNLTIETVTDRLRKRNRKAFIMLTSDSAKEIIDNRSR